MKVIITENQHRLLRRVSEIEHIINPIMDLAYEYLQGEDPSPLNMSIYDVFIHIITNKISNRILNRTHLEGYEKEHFKIEIKDFIMSYYGSVIRDYYTSRLNKGRNINESDHEIKFKRRYQEIEDGIQDFILTHKLNVMDTFDGFLTEICWDVAQDVVSKMNIPEEDYVTYRNQLIRFIKNNFYEELKEFWDRNHYWGDNKNINESYNKRMLQRRYQYFSESIDSSLSRYDVCLYTDVIDFVDRVMDDTADNLYESLFKLGRDDNHSEYYQDINDFISDHFVDRIHEFYEDSKHYCIDEDGNWIH
jgi:hypothetical protein